MHGQPFSGFDVALEVLDRVAHTLRSQQAENAADNNGAKALLVTWVCQRPPIPDLMASITSAGNLVVAVYVQPPQVRFAAEGAVLHFRPCICCCDDFIIESLCLGHLCRL